MLTKYKTQKFKIEETLGVSGLIDHDLGIIRNIKLARVCTANGFDFELDHIEAMFKKVEGKEISAHFGHTYSPNVDELETFVGVFEDFRLDGEVLRGDLHLSESAKFGRDNTNYYDKILALAENDSNNCGISPVIIYTMDDNQEFTIEEVAAFDLVNYPAFKQGLFSEDINNTTMDPITETPEIEAPEIASVELTPIIDKIAELDSAIKGELPTSDLAKQLIDLLNPFIKEEMAEDACMTPEEQLSEKIEEAKIELSKKLMAELEAKFNGLSEKMEKMEAKFSEGNKLKLNPIFNHSDDEVRPSNSKVVARRLC